MKRINLCAAIAAVLCLSAPGGAQTSNTPTWAKTYDGTHSTDDQDKGYAITTDASGNVYVTGMIDIYGDPAITTIKYNASGVQQWATTTNLVYSTSPCNVEGGFDIKVDGSGNVYVACAALVNTSTDYVDLALIKYNSSGGTVTNYPKYYTDGVELQTFSGVII